MMNFPLHTYDYQIHVPVNNLLGSFPDTLIYAKLEGADEHWSNAQSKLME